MKTLSCLLLLSLTLLSFSVHAATVSLGLVNRVGSTQQIAAVKFKELLESQSNGALTVSVVEADSKAGEQSLLTSIQAGILQVALINTSVLDEHNPITRVISFPFLFADELQADHILDGPLGTAILKDLETIGCKGLAFTENGFRNLTNNLRPVRVAADLHGMKIRTLATPPHPALWQALGATPQPLPWPIFSELEQGILEGQENPLWIAETYSFHEVQQHLTLTRHVYSAHVAVASPSWWGSLTREEQDAVSQAMTQAARLQRQGNRAKEEVRLAMLEGKGMAVEAYPDLASFRARISRLRSLDLYREPKVQALLTKIDEETARLPQSTRPVPAAPTTAPSVTGQADTVSAQPSTPGSEQPLASRETAPASETEATTSSAPSHPQIEIGQPIPAGQPAPAQPAVPAADRDGEATILDQQDVHPIPPPVDQAPEKVEAPAAAAPTVRLEHPSTSGLPPVVEERFSPPPDQIQPALDAHRAPAPPPPGQPDSPEGASPPPASAP